MTKTVFLFSSSFLRELDGLIGKIWDLRYLVGGGKQIINSKTVDFFYLSGYYILSSNASLY